MDPIADMLTRIRNAQAVGEKKITLPASKRKAAILAILKEEGYIESFEVVANGTKNDINVTLKYFQDRPVIAKIQRVSRPGLRVYKQSNAMPTILAGMGIAIVSTPKGVMTAKTARAQNMGGEVLCVVE
jgi:small subunit ribosomal protein S8